MHRFRLDGTKILIKTHAKLAHFRSLFPCTFWTYYDVWYIFSPLAGHILNADFSKWIFKGFMDLHSLIISTYLFSHFSLTETLSLWVKTNHILKRAIKVYIFLSRNYQQRKIWKKPFFIALFKTITLQKVNGIIWFFPQPMKKFSDVTWQVYR